MTIPHAFFKKNVCLVLTLTLCPVGASSSLDSHVRVWDLDSGKMAKSIDAGPGGWGNI